MPSQIEPPPLQRSPAPCFSALLPSANLLDMRVRRAGEIGLQSGPSEPGDARRESQLPAELRRQVVAYQTNEAPGTVIIDTPNTRPFDVLGGAGRSATALASGVTDLPGPAWSRSRARPSGRIGHAAGGDAAAPALSAALHGGGARQSAGRPRHVARRHHLSHSRHQRA